MLKRLFTLGTLLCWASLAPASYELDRAAQALDHGQAAKARFLYGRILDIDPCDRAAQAGLIRAKGDPSPYRSQCPPEPAASPIPSAAAQPSPAATEAPLELPAAAPAVAPPVATAHPSPVAAVTEGSEADAPQGANDIGAQPRRHPQEGGAAAHPWMAWVELMGLGVLAAGLALALVAVARRRRASVASAPTAEGKAEPEAAPEEDGFSPPVEAPHAAPTPAPVAVAPQPVGPRALPPEQSAAAPAAWASPLAPGEAVIARLDGAQAQAGLTAHQFYFQGPRGVKEGWFGRQETLMLAVPLHQVTGLAWAERSGERLIVGTALAGDIALRASDFGALALRQFAQQLASALERPLA